LWFPEAPIEAVTEFGQITGQVLGADPMLDTTNITFDIGDQGVNLRDLLSTTMGISSGAAERRGWLKAGLKFFPAYVYDRKENGNAIPIQPVGPMDMSDSPGGPVPRGWTRESPGLINPTGHCPGRISFPLPRKVSGP
jgi:hypothetical protein